MKGVRWIVSGTKTGFFKCRDCGASLQYRRRIEVAQVKDEDIDTRGVVIVTSLSGRLKPN